MTPLSFRWGYREARAYKLRRRARRIVKIIVGVSLLLGGLIVLGLLVSARSARAQGIVSPAPWCAISPPVLPAFDGQCVQPRVWLPIVEAKR